MREQWMMTNGLATVMYIRLMHFSFIVHNSSFKFKFNHQKAINKAIVLIAKRNTFAFNIQRDCLFRS